MEMFRRLFWIIVVVLLVTAIIGRGDCAKLYVLEENSVNKALPFSRLRRQTHPAATIARIPTQDNVFIPILGPSQTVTDQQPSNNLEFSSSDLVDYLQPPNPNAQITSLNFQDPSANLQNLDNIFDAIPTSSSSNINTFQSFQNSFQPGPPSPTNFQHQFNVPPQNTGTEQVQSISFQNPSLSATPSLIHSSPTPPSNPNQFIQSKESGAVHKEAVQFLNHLFKNPPQPQLQPQSRPSNFAKSEPVLSDPQPNQGKWELGYDANDILAPPNFEGAGRSNDYDTINGNRFRKSGFVSPPLQNNNIEPQNNFVAPKQAQFSPPAQPINQFNSPQFPQHNQQFTPNNQFNQNQFQQQNNFAAPPFNPQQNLNNQFNQPPSLNNQFNSANQFAASNHFAPPNNQISVPNEFVNDQADIVWGSQKQQNFGPTTSEPFLPTIPPTASNFQGNGFNNGGFQSQPPQFHSQPINNGPPIQLQNLNQNFPLETPLTSQFDSFLPQGTVSDHTFLPNNDNIRLFKRKRQVDEEDEQERDDPEEEALQSKFKVGPVYSFVKTDKNGHFKWSVRHPSKR